MDNDDFDASDWMLTSEREFKGQILSGGYKILRFVLKILYLNKKMRVKFSGSGTKVVRYDE